MTKTFDVVNQLEPSKTQRKRQMEELQDLGIRLVKLKKDQLAKLNLPINLLDAIKLAQKITANGGLRRQYQYIGKLMRSVDALEISEKLDYIMGDSALAVKNLHLAEKWRDLLLANDENFERFYLSFSAKQNDQLSQLVNLVRKEQQLGRVRNYTQLFQLIKSIIEGNHR